MYLWPKFPALEVRFVHRELGLPARLVVGFEGGFIHGVFTEVEHRGERGDFEHLGLCPEKDGRPDVNDRDVAILHIELVSTRYALTVQKGKEATCLFARVWFPHPELAKVRKLLRAGDAVIDC